MSVYALRDAFWQISEESDRAFRRWVVILLVPMLVLGLVIPLLKLSGLESKPAQVGDIRYAELLQDEPAPVAEEAEEPAPADEPEDVTEEPAPEPEAQPEPEPEPEPTPQETAAQQQERAREVAQRSGVLAFADQLKDLRDSSVSTNASQPLRTDVVTGGIGGGAAVGSAIEQSASAGSGGIGSGQVRRQQGGTGIGERRTTTVDRPAGLGAGRSAGGGGESRASGRTLEEIQLVFDRNKGSLYTLYNRALRSNASLRGVVTIKLTIAPNGRVTACEVVSSELNDPDLERKIVARIMLFDFGAKDVDAMTLDYPITFQPL